MAFTVSSVIEALLLLCCFITIKLLRPWLKANTTIKQREAINNVMDTLVNAAEQVFGSGNGSAKLAQVLDWAKAQDIEASVPDVEAAVWRLRQEDSEDEGERGEEGEGA